MLDTTHLGQDVQRALPMAPMIVSLVVLLGVVAARLVDQDKFSLHQPQTPVKIVILTVQHVVVLVQQIAYPVPVENTFLQVHASIVQRIPAEPMQRHVVVRLAFMPLLGPALYAQIFVMPVIQQLWLAQHGRQMAVMLLVLRVVVVVLEIADHVYQALPPLLEEVLRLHAQRVVGPVKRVRIQEQQAVSHVLLEVATLTSKQMVLVVDVIQHVLHALLQDRTSVPHVHQPMYLGEAIQQEHHVSPVTLAVLHVMVQQAQTVQDAR
jgi:hypothetical protein